MNIVIFIVLGILVQIAAFFAIFYIVYALGTLIPSIAAGNRRLHDTDKSGWFLLIGIIPFLGAIILIVFLATPGTPTENQYGPVPPNQS